MISKYKDFDSDKITVVEYHPKYVVITEYLNKKVIKQEKTKSSQFSCYQDFEYYYEDLIEELEMNNEFLDCMEVD